MSEKQIRNLKMAGYLTLVWLGSKIGWSIGHGILGLQGAILFATLGAILFAVIVKCIAPLIGHRPW